MFKIITILMLDLYMQVEKVVLAWSFAQEKYLGL